MVDKEELIIPATLGNYGKCPTCGGILTIEVSETNVIEISQTGMPVDTIDNTVSITGICNKCSARYKMEKRGMKFAPYMKRYQDETPKELSYYRKIEYKEDNPFGFIGGK